MSFERNGLMGLFLLQISNQLMEENIEGIAAVDGEDASISCYDIVPTEDYSTSLAEEGSTIEISHKVCVDLESGYFIDSDMTQNQVTPVTPFEGDDVTGIAFSNRIDTSFSDFGEEVEFPRVLNQEMDNSSQIVRCSFAVVVAAIVLALLN